MAVVTDLSFQQINDAASAPIFTINGNVITLNINTLTGDTFASLADLGVSEVLYKLRRFCGDATETANAAVSENERLLSFPPFTFAPPNSNGDVSVTQIQTFRIPLAVNTVKGSNPQVAQVIGDET
ncbi:MAG: hypothetical protein ACRC2R_10825 [Xenococcaceae cyanobacterium]